jgi:hypothetical protein
MSDVLGGARSAPFRLLMSLQRRVYAANERVAQLYSTSMHMKMAKVRMAE